jgi:hypothetical protein
VPRTPPRLDITIGPQPMSRLRLSRRGEGSHAFPVDALLFGRAIDASIRADSEWFVRDYPPHANPVLAIAGSLTELLRSLGDAFGSLLAKFQSSEPVEISVGLDTMHHLLVSEETDQEAVLKAVSLASELSSNLREDPGLTDGAACRMLTYAALEAYYYGRATAKAKRRFDADRGLIRCATGLVESSINQDEDLGVGISVWEGWQAIRSLRSLFGLAELAVEVERRKQHVLAVILYASDVILRMSERPVDIDAVLRSIVAVERLAEKDRRKADCAHTEAIRDELEEIARTQETEERTAAVAPAEPSERAALDRGLERAFLPRTGHDDMVPPKHRAPPAIVEDLTCVVERFEILMDGDDNSLVFEVAPVLLRTMRLLYAELSAHHERLRDAIYAGEEGLERQQVREVQALRALVEKGSSLVERYDALRTALRTGEIDVGYHTEENVFDDVTDPDPPRDPLRGVRVLGAEVRAIESKEHSLVLSLEADFEDGARHRIKVILDEATRVVWHRVNLSGGSESLGKIDRFDRDGARIRIAGRWGDVELTGAELRAAME